MNTEHQEKVDRQVCANCGGTIKWNIAKQQLECSSCRTPYEAKTTVERVEEQDSVSKHHCLRHLRRSDRGR